MMRIVEVLECGDAEELHAYHDCCEKRTVRQEMVSPMLGPDMWVDVGVVRYDFETGAYWGDIDKAGERDV